MKLVSKLPCAVRSSRTLPRAVFAIALTAILTLADAGAQTSAGLRVALVIGNAAYPTSPLSNPGNDARAMSDVLKDLGFTVIDARDATKIQMEQAIARTQDSLKGGGGVGMLYYAGHGLQLDWRNYLVPIDATLGSARDVPRQTVDVQQVLDAFKAAGNSMSIIVLDACRDNPFGATGRGAGLAQMDAQWGTFLAYATAPGNVAEDGARDGGNSLYTGYLVNELKQPAARIEDVFKRVRLQVRQQTQGQQIPWESTSLEEEFYFDQKASPLAVPESRRLSQVEATLAQEKADWDRIKASSEPDDFYSYLRKYPGGFISEQAQFRLDQLQRAKVLPQPGANGVIALPAGVDRYVVGDEWVMERTDGFNKESRRQKFRVTQADKHRVVINDGAIVQDQMGSILKNGSGVKDPGFLLVPVDLSIGKRWRSAFTNSQANGGRQTNVYELRVAALEKVTVPAGTFNAFRVERRGHGTSQDGKWRTYSGTSWIDPATMFTIRSDVEFRNNGMVTEQSSSRLVSMKRMARNQ